MISCQALNEVSSVSFLCHNLNAKLTLLPVAINYTGDNALMMQATLEQEIRMLLNIMLNLILQVRDDDQLVRDVLDPANCIEEMCFRTIKFSLEIAVVPIRKFLILFYLYLRLLFGPAPGKSLTFKYLCL